MTVDISQALYFGASQAFLMFAVLLGKRNANHLANRILAVFMLVLTIRLAAHGFAIGQIPRENPWPFAALNIQLLLGPLLYFYVRSLSEPDFRVSRSLLWHLVPILLAVLVQLLRLFFMDLEGLGETPLVVEGGSVRSFASTGITYSLFMLSIGIYSAMSIKKLQNHGVRIRNLFSALETINLKWLTLLLMMFTGYAVIGLVYELFRLNVSGIEGSRLLIHTVFMLFVIYYLTFMAMRQGLIYSPQQRDAVQQRVTEDLSDDVRDKPEIKVAGGTTSVSNNAEKYRTSSLTEHQSLEYWQQLQRVLEKDKPYLTNGLKLSDLAMQMQISTDHLSQTINTHAGVSYYDLINRYRVEEAKQLMCGEKNYSVADAAYAAGFNSKSTFYTQFKKIVGTTPASFKKHQKMMH